MVFSEYQAYLGFSVFPGIGPMRFRSLLARFGSSKDSWHAPINDVRDIIGLKLSVEFENFRKSFSVLEYENKLKDLKVLYLPQNSASYPNLLKEISDPPIGLFIRGYHENKPIDMKKTVAVVGTRNLTPYGREMADSISLGLASNGVTVVSGMARGIDAVSHVSALSCGGFTVAVLGCGVDIIAPPTNVNIYNDICASSRGRVISEMPLTHKPSKGLFPSRNRIISGLSLGVVVIEGAEDSGSLITAGYAADQGREVFAVPGPITSRTSKGPIKLLKNGAQIIESAEDILTTLGFGINNTYGQKKNTYMPENPVEAEIITIIQKDRQTPDEIVKISGIPISTVLSTLTILEIKGVIKDYGDKQFGLV